jgi:hypothetical protein
VRNTSEIKADAALASIACDPDFSSPRYAYRYSITRRQYYGYYACVKPWLPLLYIKNENKEINDAQCIPTTCEYFSATAIASCRDPSSLFSLFIILHVMLNPTVWRQKLRLHISPNFLPSNPVFLLFPYLSQYSYVIRVICYLLMLNNKAQLCKLLRIKKYLTK